MFHFGLRFQEHTHKKNLFCPLPTPYVVNFHRTCSEHGVNAQMFAFNTLWCLCLDITFVSCLSEFCIAKIREVCMAKIRETCVAENKRDLYGQMYGKNKRDLYGKNKTSMEKKRFVWQK